MHGDLAMESRTGPFRQAALDSRSHGFLGEHLIARPASFQVATYIVLAAMVVFFLIMAKAHYTSKVTLGGIITPVAGLVRVYPPAAGMLTEVRISEGQLVKQGTELFVVTNERVGRNQEDIQSSIVRLARMKKSLIEGERTQALALNTEKKKTLHALAQQLELSVANLASQIADKKKRLRVADETVASYQALAEKGAVSQESLKERISLAMDQRDRLHELEGDLIEKKYQLLELREKTSAASMESESALLKLSREAVGLEEALFNEENRNRFSITASRSGKVTAISTQLGENVSPSRAIANLVPERSKLHAELYATSKVIGFIKIGAPVYLRLQAYPYQKYGHIKGSVATISATPLPASDLNLIFTPSVNGGEVKNESLYKVTVELPHQGVSVDGRLKQLDVGLLLEGEITQETRYIYEWLFEPLYKLKENMGV